MADILIRGMEMPTQCGNCPISTNTRRCTILWREFGDPSKRLEDCPLLPLTEGHGRLGDLDALYEVAKTRSMGIYGPCDAQCVITGNDILKADTIVPAEGGKIE